MNVIYRTKTVVPADIETLWNYLIQPGFVKDFLPEIKRDLSGSSEYVYRSHRNEARTLPSYAVPYQNIGWVSGSGVTIRLPRKDVDAAIEAVTVLLKGKGNKTKVTLEVNYNPSIGKHFIFVSRCVRALFTAKLRVLKQDFDAQYEPVDSLYATAS